MKIVTSRQLFKGWSNKKQNRSKTV